MNTTTGKRHTSKELGMLAEIVASMDDLDRATDFEKFPEGKYIEGLLIGIRDVGLQLIGLNDQLMREVSKIQAGCEHSFYEIRKNDPNYRWNGNTSGELVLTEKICMKCRSVVTRPNGRPFGLCYKCWSPMRYLGREPGQGGGTHHYECTNESCQHRIEHT